MILAVDCPHTQPAARTPVHDPLGVERRQALEDVDGVDPDLALVDVLLPVLIEVDV